MQPFIYYVLAFIGNARQLISTCQINFFFLTSKIFIFENFIFRKFCLFVFDFILFFQKKKNFEIYCSQLTGQRYCSYLLFIITVHRTVHPYCSLSCNTICCLRLGHNTMVYINTLTSHSSSSLAIQFSSLLQYNFFFFLAFKPSYCNTNQVKPPAHVTIHQVYCDTTSPTKQPSFSIAIQLKLFKPTTLQYTPAI